MRGRIVRCVLRMPGKKSVHPQAARSRSEADWCFHRRSFCLEGSVSSARWLSEIEKIGSLPNFWAASRLSNFVVIILWLLTVISCARCDGESSARSDGRLLLNRVAYKMKITSCLCLILKLSYFQSRQESNTISDASFIPKFPVFAFVLFTYWDVCYFCRYHLGHSNRNIFVITRHFNLNVPSPGMWGHKGHSINKGRQNSFGDSGMAISSLPMHAHEPSIEDSAET